MRAPIRNVGLLSALCVVAVILSVLTGCAPANKGKLLVAEVDRTPTGGMKALVWCIPAGSYFPVDTATVTVNGQSVPSSFLGNISTTLTAVAAAADVTLHFTFEDMDILSTLVMPTKPTSVTNTGTTAASLITINWAPIVPAPNNVVVSVSFNTQSGEPFSAVLPGSSTSYGIPANTLLAGYSITVIVEAFNETTDLGSSVMAGSIYQVGNQSSVLITTN